MTEDADPVRVWLVERTYSDDEQNMIILTYATPDGKRDFRKERALTSFGDVRDTTAAVDVDPGNLGSVDEINGTAYKQELSEVSDVLVSVTVTEDERGLLEALHQTVFESFDREYNQLIAYNADSWSGGFDLPFLRTRCVKNGLDWVFGGVQFADMFEPVKKRLNTQHTAFGVGSDVNSLTGAHEILLDQIEGVPIQTTDDGVEHMWYQEQPYDPFDDSGSAVSHYESGDYLPILQHNLADMHRTWELGELVREYVSGRDLTDKKL